MHDYPSKIVQQAMQLPGVPSQEEVRQIMANGSTDELKIDRTKFDETRYQELLQEIIQYSLEKFTWKAKAQYMLSNIQKYYPCVTEPRILMITCLNCEYMSCLVFGAFYDAFGPSQMSSLHGPKRDLFLSLAPNSTKMYGKGFSYSRIFSDPWNKTQMDQILDARLKSGFFNMIVYVNGNNMFCDRRSFMSIYNDSRVNYLIDYQEKFDPLVVLVDGNDIDGCHRFFRQDELKLKDHARFIREYKKARKKDATLPIHWSGCNAAVNETNTTTTNDTTF